MSARATSLTPTPASSVEAPQRAARAGSLATRTEVLHAAARVFVTLGYEAASMDLIAAEAKIGRRTVYNHFKSKKALFDATIAVLWERMPIGSITHGKSPAEQPEAMLLEIGNAVANFWAPEEAVSFMRLIVREGAAHPELAESFYRYGRDPARDAVTRFLETLDAAGVLGISDCALAAGQFIDLILGEMLLDRLVAGGAPPAAKRQRYVVEQAVQMVLKRYHPA